MSASPPAGGEHPLPVTALKLRPEKSLFFFCTPKVSSVDFPKLAAKKLSAEAATNLGVVTNVRSGVVRVAAHCAERDANEPYTLRRAVEDYLPYAYTLAEETKFRTMQELPIRDKELVMEWQSILFKRHKDALAVVHRMPTFADECVQMFWLYAVAHYQMAADHTSAAVDGIDAALGSLGAGAAALEGKDDSLAMRRVLASDGSSSDSAASAAAAAAAGGGASVDPHVQRVRLLKTAAGITKWLGSTLLPTLTRVDPARPPDTWSSLLPAMVAMFEANAQEFTLAAAVARGVSRATLARVALGCAARFHAAAGGLRAVSAEYQARGYVRRSFRDYLDCKRDFYRAIAYWHLGSQAYVDAQYGKAVALLRFSRNVVHGIRIHKTRNDGLLYFGEYDVPALIRIVDAEFAYAQNDNDKVYYEPEPPQEKLEMPEPAFLIKHGEYAPPDFVPSSFFGVNQDGSSCALM